MKIYNSETLKELDDYTCREQQIDSIELMERTAEKVCAEIVRRFTSGQRFVIIAGPGNNGGDALAVGRRLIENGYRNVEIYLFNVKGHLSHDCDEERRKLILIDGVDFTEVNQQFTPPALGRGDVVVDGLFGAGLNTPLQGGFMSVANYVNESGAYVISIDVPSGLYGERNSSQNRKNMVHADLTLAIHSPRLAFFFEENADVIGEWKVLDIDLLAPKTKDLNYEYTYVEERSVRSCLHPRRAFSGKRDYGSVMLFGGSLGMLGAAVMCSRAVMKSGAGLCTVHSAKYGMSVLQTAVPEVMFEPDRNDKFITDMTLHHDHQAVAVGPGIGTHTPTIDALESLLKNCKAPLVIDADGLNCISERPALLQLLPPNTILTPHIGEFDRLFGEHYSAEERLFKAVEQAKYYGVTIVLKGHYTAVVRPSGRVYFNSTGNPGMATAGSGDVLTGIIAAFISQGYRPDLAATIGVYIHGLAGDLAAEELGEFGVTAPEIANRVGRAIRKVLGSK